MPLLRVLVFRVQMPLHPSSQITELNEDEMGLAAAPVRLLQTLAAASGHLSPNRRRALLDQETQVISTSIRNFRQWVRLWKDGRSSSGSSGRTSY